jgi:hypothetical protein
MSNEYKDPHTYEFGYAGNSYFNGRDGVVTRDDGKTITFNGRDGMLAVEVKDYNFGLRDSAPEDVKRMAAELPRRQMEWGDEVSFDEWAYEVVARRTFWDDAEWCCTDDPAAPEWAKGVYSSGRSGGWCCIDGTQWLLEHGFPSVTPDFMVKEGGGYKEYAICTWENGKILETGTKVIEAYDDLDEAEARLEELRKSDTHGFDIDEDTAQELTMRDEFIRLAFDIHGCIDGAHEALEEYIREEYAELEAKRNANIIRSSN